MSCRSGSLWMLTTSQLRFALAGFSERSFAISGFGQLV